MSHLSDSSSITVVLNEDGTEVDEYFFETVPANTVLLILTDGDEWRPGNN